MGMDWDNKGLDRNTLDAYRQMMKNADTGNIVLDVKDCGNGRVLVTYADRKLESISYEEVEGVVKLRGKRTKSYGE